MLLKIATGERSGISARLLRDDADCWVAPCIWLRPTTTLPHLVVRIIATQREGWFAIESIKQQSLRSLFAAVFLWVSFRVSFRLQAWQHYNYDNTKRPCDILQPAKRSYYGLHTLTSPSS